MALADDITDALQAGAKAGAAAASTAGRDLSQDIETFVVPHLRDIGLQLASIAQKRIDGIYNDVTAKALIGSEVDAIQTVVETEASLVAFEAQTVVNSIVDALNGAINTAVGFALLA
jgi:hypothetical protein